MLLVHSVFALLFSGADLYPNVKKIFILWPALLPSCGFFSLLFTHTYPKYDQRGIIPSLSDSRADVYMFKKDF